MAIYTLMKYYGSKRRMVPVINSCLPNDYKVWIEGLDRKSTRLNSSHIH